MPWPGLLAAKTGNTKIPRVVCIDVRCPASVGFWVEHAAKNITASTVQEEKERMSGVMLIFKFVDWSND